MTEAVQIIIVSVCVIMMTNTNPEDSFGPFEVAATFELSGLELLMDLPEVVVFSQH